MKILRTPDHCFDRLDGYDFEPNYFELDSDGNDSLRLHYLDEGNPSATPILLLHGEPSWSYLYRKMIPGLVEAGHRVIVPDLIGFGRSDKPIEQTDYSYASHLDWMTEWLHGIDLENIVLFCQDWGGLLGLRLLAAEPERFLGCIAANTFLPTGDHEPSDAFIKWRDYSQTVKEFPVGGIIQGATESKLSEQVVAAYDAPFPDERYKAGVRRFPTLVPISPDNVESQNNRDAWRILAAFDKPFLTAFSDKDPITAGGAEVFQKVIAGCKKQKHVTIECGGHFLQEDKGEELANVINQFIKDNKLAK